MRNTVYITLFIILYIVILTGLLLVLFHYNPGLPRVILQLN